MKRYLPLIAVMTVVAWNWWALLHAWQYHAVLGGLLLIP